LSNPNQARINQLKAELNRAGLTFPQMQAAGVELKRLVGRDEARRMVEDSILPHTQALAEACGSVFVSSLVKYALGEQDKIDVDEKSIIGRHLPEVARWVDSEYQEEARTMTTTNSRDVRLKRLHAAIKEIDAQISELKKRGTSGADRTIAGLQKHRLRFYSELNARRVSLAAANEVARKPLAESRALGGAKGRARIHAGSESQRQS
jgi:uncharacterized protein YdcH (DUF465 family)